jgi:hypothetical protein
MAKCLSLRLRPLVVHIMLAAMCAAATIVTTAAAVDGGEVVTCTPETTGPDGGKFDLRTMNTVAYRADDRENDRYYVLHVCTPGSRSSCSSAADPDPRAPSMCRKSTSSSPEDPPLLLSLWSNEEHKSEVTFESFRDSLTGQRGLTIHTHLVTPGRGQHFTRVDIVCSARGALLNASAVASGPDILTQLHYRINHQAGCAKDPHVDIE